MYALEYFCFLFDQGDVFLSLGDFCLEVFYLLIVVLNLHEILLLFLSTFFLGFCEFLNFILPCLESFVEPDHLFLKQFYLYILSIDIVLYIIGLLHCSATKLSIFLIYS